MNNNNNFNQPLSQPPQNFNNNTPIEIPTNSDFPTLDEINSTNPNPNQNQQANPNDLANINNANMMINNNPNDNTTTQNPKYFGFFGPDLKKNN